MTAGISHDLRTPVASVQAMAEALSAGVLDSEADRRRYLDLMQREIERLSRMIDDLFDLAQLDAGAFKLDLKVLPIEEIIADVVCGMAPQAREKGVKLEFNVEGQAMLPHSRRRPHRRVVANLIPSAIEHTPAGGRIELTLRERAISSR
jgi:signal transduction histidine kinase